MVDRLCQLPSPAVQIFYISIVEKIWDCQEEEALSLIRDAWREGLKLDFVNYIWILQIIGLIRRQRS